MADSKTVKYEIPKRSRPVGQTGLRSAPLRHLTCPKGQRDLRGKRLTAGALGL